MLSILSMVVPLASGIGFAEKEISHEDMFEKRNSAVFIDRFRDREELIDLAASIPATSLTPVKVKDY